MSDQITRREFHSRALAAGAAASVAPMAFARRTASDTLKVGLIGCGGRGTGAALQAIKADPGAVLWAMGDAFRDRLDGSLGYLDGILGEMGEDEPEGPWQDRVSVDESRKFVGFDAIDRVLATGVDVVILTTPPAFRPEHLAKAVAAGVHAFCEKPVAVDTPGVRSVIESARVAREKNLSLMSGFCWRYQDQVTETFDHLLAGGVGQIHTIQSTYNTTGWIKPKPRHTSWDDTTFQLRNWHYFVPISGDHIVEQAVHAIDWIGWAKGDVPPARCWGVGSRSTRPDTAETGNVYDNFSVVFEYADGSRGYHTCRHWPNTASDNSAYVLGSDGRCTMKPWSGEHVVEGAKPWKGSAASNDMYQREHDVLFKAIRSGKRVDDGDAMASTTMMSIMARMAACTGELVTWEQAMASTQDLNPEPWAFGKRETPALAIPGKAQLS